ncbi:unnamed protein product [Owenia fusiformis]|uniref:Histone acetyltransferase n=1 Tax=Owenia fusiformis TaxID=6347 RepID=A0A8S4N5R1_OWEFU|nr:unnamed protein product [Owenia fusiformis]
MAEVKNKDIILDTIDQLRKRKARPDIERICHMIQRRHGLTCEETAEDLDSLVQAGIVIKVDYKGNTSYRNAAKWRKSHLGLNVKEIHAALDKAIRSLKNEDGIVESASGEMSGELSASGEAKMDNEKGYTAAEIERWLLIQDPDTKLQQNILQIALQREVEFGRLLQFEDGKFGVGDHTKRVPGKTAGKTSSGAGGKHTSPTNKSEKDRPASIKRKRIKKTHGPDFESYDGLKSDARCDYCLLTSVNRNGEPEDLLICKDCSAKAHPSCMQYSDLLSRRARNSPWQCIDCKTCYLCQDSGDAVSDEMLFCDACDKGYHINYHESPYILLLFCNKKCYCVTPVTKDEMLFCDACDKGYHMNCHEPPVREKPTGKWVCSQCLLDDADSAQLSNSPESEMNDSFNTTDGGAASFLPTPVESPVNGMNGAASPSEMISPKPVIPAAIKDEIPDASDWTMDDVVEYFKKKGFEEQADIFKEQEIDGKSLLLLKRNDVLTGLALKLGPALKIFKHVEKLQTRGQTMS